MARLKPEERWTLACSVADSRDNRVRRGKDNPNIYLLLTTDKMISIRPNGNYSKIYLGKNIRPLDKQTIAHGDNLLLSLNRRRQQTGSLSR